MMKIADAKEQGRLPEKGTPVKTKPLKKPELASALPPLCGRLVANRQDGCGTYENWINVFDVQFWLVEHGNGKTGIYRRNEVIDL